MSVSVALEGGLSKKRCRGIAKKEKVGGRPFQFMQSNSYRRIKRGGRIAGEVRKKSGEETSLNQKDDKRML